jgi:Ca-activated chloride channel family protein
MSFASPLWLLSLALVPIALAAYIAARRRARRFAVRFTAVPALALAAGSGLSWRRHIPAALALATLAALGLALARPHATVAQSVNTGSIMLVTDHSGSMAATDVSPTRLAAAEHSADNFINHLPSTVRVGAVAFGSSPDAVQAPVANHSAARAIIDGQVANGSTATGDALSLGLQLLNGSNPKHAPAAMVLLSDGAANAGQNSVTVAQTARRDHIPIYTVALGTANGTLTDPSDPFGPPIPVPPDPQLMAQIAAASGGRAFNAQSAGELDSIYKSLGTRLGSVTHKEDVTAEFAIGGLVLLVFAAASSTRWSGILP